MFRLLIAAIAAAMLLSFAPSADAQEPPPLLGDVDCSGWIDSVDVVHILFLDAGLVEVLPCADGGSDVNDDGNVDTIDASIILQFVAGLIGELPPTPPEPLPSPASGGVAIGAAEAVPGQQSMVAVEARGITAPGLGAWTIDVGFDPSVISLVDCIAELGGVCNEDFATGLLRISGASAGGLEGVTKLANLTFQCEGVAGASDLTLNPRAFADATLGGPQPFVPTVTNGSITCAEPAPTLVVTVIHDLDADGVFDPGEPGLEGWSVDVFPGCIDVFIALEATDAEGRTTAEIYGQNLCVNVRQVGWVLTSGSSLVNVQPGTTVEAIFLFRKVGQEYLRLTGDLLVDGLPANDTVALDAVVGGRSCGDAQIDVRVARTRYSLYILGDADGAECAAEGQSVDITVNGTAVHNLIFIPNRLDSENVDLILGPSPMWFVGSGRDGIAPVPYVGTVACGEARSLAGGQLPPDYHEIYVLPDALRTGCGAPGRIVTLRVGDEVLRNLVWREGFVPFDELQDVELPRVGAFAPTSGSGFSLTVGGARIYTIALAIAGLFLVSGGTVIWRRRWAG